MDKQLEQIRKSALIKLSTSLRGYIAKLERRTTSLTEAEAKCNAIFLDLTQQKECHIQLLTHHCEYLQTYYLHTTEVIMDENFLTDDEKIRQNFVSSIEDMNYMAIRLFAEIMKTGNFSKGLALLYIAAYEAIIKLNKILLSLNINLSNKASLYIQIQHAHILIAELHLKLNALADEEERIKHLDLAEKHCNYYAEVQKLTLNHPACQTSRHLALIKFIKPAMQELYFANQAIISIKKHNLRKAKEYCVLAEGMLEEALKIWPGMGAKLQNACMLIGHHLMRTRNYALQALDWYTRAYDVCLERGIDENDKSAVIIRTFINNAKKTIFNKKLEWINSQYIHCYFDCRWQVIESEYTIAILLQQEEQRKSFRDKLDQFGIPYEVSLATPQLTLFNVLEIPGKKWLRLANYYYDQYLLSESTQLTLRMLERAPAMAEAKITVPEQVPTETITRTKALVTNELLKQLPFFSVARNFELDEAEEPVDKHIVRWKDPSLADYDLNEHPDEVGYEIHTPMEKLKYLCFVPSSFKGQTDNEHIHKKVVNILEKGVSYYGHQRGKNAVAFFTPQEKKQIYDSEYGPDYVGKVRGIGDHCDMRVGLRRVCEGVLMVNNQPTDVTYVRLEAKKIIPKH